MGDRADRLNQRRQDTARSKNQSDQQAPASSEEPDTPAESESGQQSESTESIKDQYKGIYMFLPEDLLQEFNIVASEMDTQRQRRTGKHVEKIRHFEPLMISLALEKAEELDEDELEERLAKFDP